MFKIKKRYFALIFFLCIFYLFVFFSDKYVPPILMYHSITAKAVDNRLAVSAGTFERQMRFLKNNGYNVIPLESLSILIKEKRDIPAKTVALTFDDGHKNTFTRAFPILKKYGLPATMFIIINEVDRAQGDRLSWEEIRTMSRSGLIDFGSHCLDPEPLVNLKSEEEIRRQIFASKRALEEKLSGKVDLFSYPEGLFNGKIKQLVIEAGYSAAVATNPGKSRRSDDVFALKRIRISENAKNMFVFAVESSGFYTFMKEWKKRKR